MSARWMTLGCIAAAMVALAMASEASAEACDASGACAKGFTCENQGAPPCVGSQPACDPADAKCVVPDPVPCDTTEIKECVPSACKADTDCAEGMVCFEQSYQECAGGTDVACAKGQDCGVPAPVPADCTTHTTSTCTPSYLVPCMAAADCGEGFTCDAQEQCVCAGSSGGSSSGSGGAATPGGNPPALDAGTVTASDAGAANPGCSCTPSAEKSCQLVEITCTSASDCPSSWTCEAQGTTGGVACADTRPVFVGDGGVGDAGSGSHCDPVEPTVTESRCMPPFYEFYAHASASGADKGGALGSVQNESAGGAPRAPSDGSADAGPATGSEGTDSVCSVARVHGASGRPNSAWLATLSLLGLAFASRRRSRAAR